MENLEKRISEVLANNQILDFSTKGMTELVQEISIYHQELEYQNEELRRIQAELEETKIHLTALFEEGPLGYLVCDEDLQIIKANNYFLKLVSGSSTVDGSKLTELVDPDSQDKLYLYFREISKNKISDSVEIDLRINEKRIPVKLDSNIFLSEQKTFYRIAVSDLSEQKKAETKLKESEEKYRSLTQSAHDGIVTTNIMGKIISWNAGATEIFGYSEEDILGKDLSIILPGNVEAGLPNYLKQFGTGSKPRIVGQTIELRGLRRNNEEFPLELSLSEWQASGQIYFTAIIRDISRRKSIESQIKLLGRSVEQSPVSIVITDKDSKIEYVNSTFKTTTGYTFEEVTGRTPRILNSGFHSISFFKKLYETILSGKEWKGEVLNKKKNGQLFWEDIHISPILNEKEEITHFVSVRDDITEKKKILEELVIAKEKAEESDKLKMAFLANMSHEIRTPMNGIMGFLDLLKNPELTEVHRSQYLGIARKSSERLLNTINDIIEISKIEAGQTDVHYSEVDINELLVFLHVFFKLETDRKEIDFRLVNPFNKADYVIQTDKNKLESIIGNLLKNAVKFTSKGFIEFGCELKPGKLLFYVKDSGPGIPADRQDAIFQRFVQADTRLSRLNEGSGLGLSIAKAFAEMLSGELWLNSSPGVGSTFFFSLPCNQVKPEVQSPKTEQKEVHIEKSGALILIAEDDESSFMYLEDLLVEEGFRLLHAFNGKEAIKLCKMNPEISLILMDIKMPEMDGLEATKEIRKFNPTIPIIAQTAYALPADRQVTIDAGCNDYVSKPIKREALLSAIRKAL